MRLRALVAMLVATAACGGDDDEVVRPLLDDIGPAIAAVEAERGGPQQYFEINATPQVVNVFVAIDDSTRAVSNVYVGGELGPAGQEATAEGATFSAGAVTFDPATILDGVTSELPDSDIVLFTIVGGPDGAVQYSARVQSDAGGTLDVLLDPSGAVQSVDPGT